MCVIAQVLRAIISAMVKILIVEDDTLVAGLARSYLEQDQHIVEVSGTVADAYERLKLSTFDLLILDWNLPGGTGVEICRNLRAERVSTPILIITGKGAINDKEVGYSSGADDYLTKPFDMRELRFKVLALIRRTGSLRSERLTCGALTLEIEAARVLFHGTELRLQRQEFALLSFLMHHPGIVFNAETLLQRVWQADEEVTEIALRSCIAKLRKKLRAIAPEDPIRTLPGFGYSISEGQESPSS